MEFPSSKVGVIVFNVMLQMYVINCDLFSASKDGVPESALRPSLLSALSTTSDFQGCKLGNGKCQVVICEYQHFQVVIMNRPPFIITLVGSSTANTGCMLSLGEESFSPILEELTKIVVE